MSYYNIHIFQALHECLSLRGASDASTADDSDGFLVSLDFKNTKNLINGFRDCSNDPAGPAALHTRELRRDGCFYHWLYIIFYSGGKPFSI